LTCAAVRRVSASLSEHDRTGAITYQVENLFSRAPFNPVLVKRSHRSREYTTHFPQPALSRFLCGKIALMNQPFIQIGAALVNINAIAAVTKDQSGALLIRLIGPHSISVKRESADAVSKALAPFINPTFSGAHDAVLGEH